MFLGTDGEVQIELKDDLSPSLVKKGGKEGRVSSVETEKIEPLALTGRQIFIKDQTRQSWNDLHYSGRLLEAGALSKHSISHKYEYVPIRLCQTGFKAAVGVIPIS